MAVDNSETQKGRVIRWVTLAFVPAVAFAGLLATTPPLGLDQLGAAPLEPVLLILGRWAGLVLAGWLLATQLLYTLAIITRTDWLVEILRPVTLPLVRRIAAGAATITLSFNGLVATAQTTPEPQPVVVEQTEHTGLRQEATPTPVLQPLLEAKATAACLVTEPEGSYSAPLTWLVRPGDHLWSIAGEHLAIVLDRPPTAGEHRRYWVEVVNASRPVIRSGDPDLIYPGEEIPLPPTLDAGIRP
jgi:hypothetical protein